MSRSQFRPLLTLVTVAFFLSVGFAQIKQPEVSDVKQTIENYHKSIRDNNAAELERQLADDYQLVGHDGEMTGKDVLIAETRSGGWKVSKCHGDNFAIRVYGEMAVVIGDWHEQGIRDGEAYDVRQRFTSVFSKQDGRWIVVSDHVSDLKAR